MKTGVMRNYPRGNPSAVFLRSRIKEAFRSESSRLCGFDESYRVIAKMSVKGQILMAIRGTGDACSSR